MARAIVTIDRNQRLGNVNSLKEPVKRAYWILLDSIVEMREYVELPLEEDDELLEVYEALEYDYPEVGLIWDYESCGYFKRKRNGRTEMSLRMSYKGTRAEIENRIRKVDEKVRKIIEESLGGKTWTDQEMVDQICKYMVTHYHYSASIGKNKKGKNIYPKDSYTIECLLKGDGVCAGMASSLTYILHKLQIPVVTVLGDAAGTKEKEAHAWNIVQQVDGSYRHIDVTWDLAGNALFLEYRNLDDIAMRVRRHFWETDKYPCCV